MKSCPSCYTVRFNDAEACPFCAAVAGAHCNVTPCVVCRKMMPADAWRCGSCSTYQKWPHLPMLTIILSVCGGAIAVGSAVISMWVFIHQSSSHTYFKVGRSKGSAISVKLWNTGRSPSTVVGCELLFDSLPGKQTTLELVPNDSADAKSVIAAGPPVVIGFTRAVTDELPAAVRKTEIQHDDVAPLPSWPSAQHMTLIVHVQESSDDPGEYHVLREKFLSKPIASFIAGNYGLVEPTDAAQ